ncbi:hypothetical protein T069G_02426 [Trichoderma breve]|uniref:Uncharacterized protein n=1 Tax=Trichoderma breve TaxID=2034170 RepID=A0A9W9E9B1_9HYPO|nr:hypothetical protein T069G_02426 [Trichoderma breve]KAJ4861472.1 hypothetical protein T069G_02426 [Trichoderma breve]
MIISINIIILVVITWQFTNHSLPSRVVLQNFSLFSLSHSHQTKILSISSERWWLLFRLTPARGVVVPLPPPPTTINLVRVEWAEEAKDEAKVEAGEKEYRLAEEEAKDKDKDKDKDKEEVEEEVKEESEAVVLVPAATVVHQPSGLVDPLPERRHIGAAKARRSHHIQ